jgi:hypothetical protein
MKFLLQDTRTALFFRNLDAWTTNPGEAFNFKCSERAVNYAYEHHLGEVQIVMIFPASGHVETIPFPKQLHPFEKGD